MKCYIFNSSISPKNSAVMIESMLSQKDMKKVQDEAKKLATELANSGAKKVKIYGSNSSESGHVVSILEPVLERSGLMLETDVSLSDNFRDRNYGSVYDHSPEKVGISKIFKSKEARSLLKSNLNMSNAHGIEKKGDYEARVFDAVEGVLRENTDDSVVILVVGDEFIRTCQKNEDIHSMFYFGDEHLIDPRLFRMRHYFNPYNSDMISACNDAMVNESTLRSRMQIPFLQSHEVVLEVPETDGLLTTVYPVYHKYAKIKLEKEIREREESEAQITAQKN